MSLRCLRIFGLTILAFSLSGHAQSVADAARQSRAEERQNGDGHLKVITNDDIASPKPAPLPPADATPEKSGKDGDEGAQTGSATDGAKKTPESEADAGQAKDRKHSDQAAADPAKDHAARALESQRRTDEIDKQYVDKIATIRQQIDTAQQTIAKLQQDQIESTNLFRQSAGVAPSIPEYEQQMRSIDEQLETQRNLIVSLKTQLDDAHEAARHAGVPHAYDY
jgi:DNA repair exonuclease SbcCD ATPase subunit